MYKCTNILKFKYRIPHIMYTVTVCILINIYYNGPTKNI